MTDLEPLQKTASFFESGGEAPLGRVGDWLRELGVSAEAAAKISERIKPGLIAYEAFTNENPPADVVNYLTWREVANEHRIAWQQDSSLSRLAENCRTAPDDTEADARWDQAVAATAHHEPARVAAYRFLGQVMAGGDRHSVRAAADQLVREVTSLLDKESIKKVPGERRGEAFWRGLAGIAWQRTEAEQERRRTEVPGAVGLSLAVTRLQGLLTAQQPRLGEVYTVLSQGTYLVKNQPRRLDRPDDSEERVRTALGREDLDPTERQRADRIQVRPEGLIIDNQLFGKTGSEPVPQQLLRLHLLRALNGQDPIEPTRAEKIVRGG